MAGILESLGQGLQGAGAVLSPEVYKTQAVERENLLPNMLRSLQFTKMKRTLDADAKFSEVVGGLQPSALKDSGALLETMSKVPADILAESPRAQAMLGMASQMQQREAAQAQKKEALQLRYDQLSQQADIARQRSEDTRLGIQERAESDKRAQAIRLEIAKMTDAARRDNIDLRREMAADRKANREANEDAAALSDKELNFMARQAWAGDTSVFNNIGRGAQGAKNIVALRREIMKIGEEQGKTPEEMASKVAEFQGIKAGQRTLGTRSANIEMAVSEAQNLMPIALQASEKVDRTRFPTINSVLQAAEKGTGDENVVRLASATNALINVYSRAIAPTGTPTVSDKDHAREIIDKAYSKGQYRAVVDLMKQEMEAARKSPDQVRDSLRESVTGKKTEPKVVNWGDLK